MSTSMYWRPARPQGEHRLPYGLKRALSQRFWGHDGSIYGGDVTLGAGEVSYLQGLADGASNEEIREGAEELMKAIRDYGEIVIFIAG